MKNFFTFFLICLTPALLNASKNNIRTDYIKAFSAVAVQQMKAFKIPASITLAQGILESGSGNSYLARSSNNHFGIKCGSTWKGKTSFHDDDVKNECFRAYSKVLESYIDHSKFLTTNQRYASLFDLNISDYKSWAYGLSKAGYATNPHYAKRLIQLIEDEALYEFDGTISQASITRESPINKKGAEISINKLHVITSFKGDTFYKLSKRTGLTLRQLHKYNAELNTSSLLNEGTPVYLQNKRRRSHSKTFVIVEHGITLEKIAQNEGIRIKALMKINHISTPLEPLENGIKIFLR